MERNNSNQSSSSGFSMVAALVGAGLVALAVLLLTQAFSSFSRGKVQLTRRLQGDELLVVSAAGLQGQDFEEILNQCRARGALNPPAPINGPCVVRGAFNPALRPAPPGAGPEVLEVRRAANGDPDPNGFACVELVECRHRAAGRLLEVTLQGHWEDKSGLTARRLSFRRTRW